MGIKEEKLFITPKQAESCLLNGDNIHTFRSVPGTLIGADWERKNILEAFETHKDTLQIGGVQCKAMKHGIVFEDIGGYVFVECNIDELNKLELPSQLTATKLEGEK